MRYYKDYNKSYIGESDIASVVARTWNDSYILHFGGDRSYHAYIVDSECEIPDHYNLKKSFDGPWIMIFDDNRKLLTITISTAKK